MVKEYIDKKGNNHHVVFLVDEIGQYIGEDSKLMLNLQTVTEDLGSACGGKAWVAVTSQQDIDSITKTKGNDFSKSKVVLTQDFPCHLQMWMKLLEKEYLKNQKQADKH